jgi:hypothetical protein
VAWVTAVLVAAVIFFLFATSPAAPRSTAWAGDAGIPPRTVSGAVHVHTTRSDGAADRATVAAAAARAGLAFVIIADHGDGTRPPEAPAYLDGVLCIDGVEISTNGGHYVAPGLPQAPYPLGGEAAAVVEDVARLGGFGFAAHADSARPELAWTDWSLPIDGVEWLNADSEWRNEGRARLLRVLFDYLVRPGPAMASMLDRPVATLTKWDVLSSRRRLVAVAGHDAHGGIGRGEEGGAWRGVPVPSYEASFRTFATRVVLDAPITGHDAAADAAAVLAALRAGRTFTAVDAFASPAYLDFRAVPAGEEDRGRRLEMGSVGEPRAVSFLVDASVPPGAAIVLMRSAGPAPGAEIGRAEGGRLVTTVGRAAGAYRVEVRAPDAPGHPPVPWLVSNPIYFFAPETPRPTEAVAAAGEPMPFPIELPWHVEHETASSGSVSEGGSDLRFEYRLGGGEPRSQFVALAADFQGGLPAFTDLQFTARASRPMRVSVQLRFPSTDDARWGRSVYLDSEPRAVTIRRDDLIPMARQEMGMPPPSAARSVLFVIDLTNARPGDSGTIELAGLAFRR